MPKKIVLTGKKFVRLLVLEATPKRKRKNIVWKCQCDCGVICEKITTDLVNGRIKSCGCLFDDFSKTLRLPPGEYGFRKLLRRYKENAKYKGLIFNIPEEIFRALTQLDCFYCGRHPQSLSQPNDIVNASPQAFENGKYTYNGLDRADNEIGYVVYNVVPCCEFCNRAKLTMTQEEFILLTNRVANRHPRVLP